MSYILSLKMVDIFVQNILETYEATRNNLWQNHKIKAKTKYNTYFSQIPTMAAKHLLFVNDNFYYYFVR